MESKKQFKTIDEYIRTFPKEVQGILEKMRQTIRKAAPEAVETISYQMPTFKLNGKSLVYLRGTRTILDFIRFPRALKPSSKNYHHTRKERVQCNFRSINPFHSI